MASRSAFLIVASIWILAGTVQAAEPAPLRAGVATLDITNKTILPQNDPLSVKALVLQKGKTTAVIITVDAVAIGEIGSIPNDYLSQVRGQLQKDLSISPESILVNASHCHGKVCADVADKTIQAVKKAASSLVPVRVGVGVGTETGVSENRRLKLKSGEEVDVRHAYSMPPDDQVAEIGPIDPEIGVLRLDTLDGKTLAVVYNFACHPIMGLPNGDNTADIVGFASRVIESNLSYGTLALFIQGCGGDINPVRYKSIHEPRHAEPLGQKLGLSVLQTVRKIQCRETETLQIHNERISLPRADHADRIAKLTAEENRLVKAFRGTTLNLKTFLELSAKYPPGAEFPSYYSHRYLREQAQGKDDLRQMDESNRKNLAAYVKNIEIMEQLTRVQTNRALLEKHQARALAVGRKPLDVEMVGFRVGDFVLVTSPGELTVEIGLTIKKQSPIKPTFVAGYTNGYIYYTPTARQLRNPGAAQEDSDCQVAPEWEALFYKRVAGMLKKLQ